MKDLHLDIETGDPDDLWTLAFLSTHPNINLKGISVCPGGRDQIGLVKKLLQKVGRDDIPVGANVKKDEKIRVSNYYTKWLGKIDLKDPDEDLIGLTKITQGSDLLTGGPLSNIDYIISSFDKIPFVNWTCQGGFVGSDITTEKDTLSKFSGKLTVPTYNLNGNPKSSLKLLNINNNFKSINMVGKNVCHGFVFDQKQISNFSKGKHFGLDIMIKGLDVYFKNKSNVKALHDLLAALLFINPTYGTWVNGLPYREKGKWGFTKYNNITNIKALININKESIVKDLL